MIARNARTRPLIWTQALLIAGCLLGFTCAPAQAAPALVISCSPSNDLYRVLVAAGRDLRRFDTPGEAIGAAAEDSGVLLLADGYPAKTTAVDADLYAAASRKRLRVYVEFPAWLPDLKLGPTKTANWERTVVASDAFGPGLAKMRILMIQNCHFLPVEVPQAHLVLARVAGFDSAVYGLPNKNVWPILFEHPRGGWLVASTKLSQFVTARYAPADAWSAVWQMILGWVAPKAAAPELKWTPTVRPTWSRNEPLSPDAELQAIYRGVDWYTKARLFIHPDWPARLRTLDSDRVEPGPSAGLPVGDGSLGILEAFSSAIQADGTQPVRYFARADCNSEAAMALALRGSLGGDARSLLIASNLLDFVDFNSPIQQGPRADPKSPSFGLMGWDTRAAGATVYYGDDNARAVLGQLAAAAALKSDRWDESILRCILANFRTTGPSGYRNARIEEPELQNKSWTWFWEQSDGGWGGYRECPHYQAYSWSMNLWLYRQTQFAPLLKRTERGIRHMMRSYPQGWQAESAREEGERCRMLLPLAWLVRVADTPEHRQWLDQVAQYVIEHQDRSGAIAQRVTHTARRNEEYGTGECALIHANGDPATDLLYAANFALLGLHEAAAATGGADLKKAEDRLADFLIRIQARSSHPAELDGVWFRGFDFRRWDYWGSNGDVGWGVWATETGWTQGWIAGVLALRQMKTSFWELTAGSKIARHMDQLRPSMLPEDALNAKRLNVAHLALGKGVVLARPPAPQYAADGPESLTDGFLGSEHAFQNGWLGWQGEDMTGVLDLGESQPLQVLAARFLQHVPVGIFLPSSVEFAISQDGRDFETVATVKPNVSPREPGPLIKRLEARVSGKSARYVRIKARNLGLIPAWHSRSPGAPAWLFCDELLINPQP